MFSFPLVITITLPMHLTDAAAVGVAFSNSGEHYGELQHLRHSAVNWVCQG
jgi:hypothetical protein